MKYCCFIASPGGLAEGAWYIAANPCCLVSIFFSPLQESFLCRKLWNDNAAICWQNLALCYPYGTNFGARAGGLNALVGSWNSVWYVLHPPVMGKYQGRGFPLKAGHFWTGLLGLVYGLQYSYARHPHVYLNGQSWLTIPHLYHSSYL